MTDEYFVETSHKPYSFFCNEAHFFASPVAWRGHRTCESWGFAFGRIRRIRESKGAAQSANTPDDEPVVGKAEERFFLVDHGLQSHLPLP